MHPPLQILPHPVWPGFTFAPLSVKAVWEILDSWKTAAVTALDPLNERDAWHAANDPRIEPLRALWSECDAIYKAATGHDRHMAYSF